MTWGQDMTHKAQQLKSITFELLNADTPRHRLRPEVLKLVDILTDAQVTPPPALDDIADGETRTVNGLAISPKMAAMCADDYVRTIAFVRGAHAAIKNFRKRVTGRPARILYIGCGPYATLALPLMSVFSSSDALFTLVDIHPVSIASARSIIETLDLTDSVSSYETMDAADYRAETHMQPDIILIEILLACLKAEPQVAVARHIMTEFPDAQMVPEDISVELSWIDTRKELHINHEPTDGPTPKRDRIDLGTAFALNVDTIKTWRDITGDTLPGATMQLPATIDSRYEPHLFTRIQVYQDHVLQNYDSGLSYPQALRSPAEFKSKDTIRFSYNLGSHPELIATILPT